MLGKERKLAGFNKIRLIIPAILVMLVLLAGCTSPASSDDKAFTDKYAAAQKKYEKYIQKTVSGQDVLDLIDNWDETDFDLTVEKSDGNRFCVSDIDKNDTTFNYWDEGSEYYIDPNASYEGTFILYQSPRNENDKDIVELSFSLVK